MLRDGLDHAKGRLSLDRAFRHLRASVSCGLSSTTERTLRGTLGEERAGPRRACRGAERDLFVPRDVCGKSRDQLFFFVPLRFSSRNPGRSVSCNQVHKYSSRIVSCSVQGGGGGAFADEKPALRFTRNFSAHPCGEYFPPNFRGKVLAVQQQTELALVERGLSSIAKSTSGE